MDYMFRRWVRLPTVLALVKPKYGTGEIQVRFYSEDKPTLEHYPWLRLNDYKKEAIFPLYDTEFGGHRETAKNGELAKLAEKFVAKTITIDRMYLDKVNHPCTTDCFLIEVKENEK